MEPVLIRRQRWPTKRQLRSATKSLPRLRFGAPEEEEKFEKGLPPMIDPPAVNFTDHPR